MAEAPARVTGKTVIALLLFQTLALFARAYSELELVSRGVAGTFAKYLSYLVVPAILALFCWPVIKDSRAFLRRQFDPARLTVRTVACGIGIGIVLRLAWWSQLVASIAFGRVVSAGSEWPAGPFFSFNCEPLATLAIYLLCYACLAPVIEETVHRGYLLRAFLARGRLPAVAASSALFALYHVSGTVLHAFVFGTVAAVLALRSATLWPSLIAHLTYNGLIALDWLCLRGAWMPRGGPSELWPIGLIASLSLIVCGAALVALVRQIEPGPVWAPARSGLA